METDTFTLLVSQSDVNGPMEGFDSSPRQLLIRQPRRPISRIAQSAPLIFLIAREIPFEPLHMATRHHGSR